MYIKHTKSIIHYIICSLGMFCYDELYIYIINFINARRSSGWQKLSNPRNLQEGTPPPSFAAIIKAEEQEYTGKTKYILLHM